MTGNADRARATAILTEYLQGNFMSRFSIGDTFDLCFDSVWLIAHDVLSEDEARLTQWYESNYASFTSVVDKEYPARATILAAHMRKAISAVELDEACNLTLYFEDDSKLVFPSNVDIVDWQWALSETGTIPYVDYMVTCFWTGEIAITENPE